MTRAAVSAPVEEIKLLDAEAQGWHPLNFAGYGRLRAWSSGQVEIVRRRRGSLGQAASDDKREDVAGAAEGRLEDEREEEHKEWALTSDRGSFELKQLMRMVKQLMRRM